LSIVAADGSEVVPDNHASANAVLAQGQAVAGADDAEVDEGDVLVDEDGEEPEWELDDDEEDGVQPQS
jgi:hypothetical protein